jgi:hypothetical protein
MKPKMVTVNAPKRKHLKNDIFHDVSCPAGTTRHVQIL